MSVMADVAAGVLATALFLAGGAVGASVWRLIGGLTGGSWSRTPALAQLSRMAPAPLLIALAARVVLAFCLTPTVGAGGSAEAYRSAPWLIARLVLAGVVWIGLDQLSRRGSRVAAGVGLLLYGLVVSLMAVDLITSLEPGWVSSAEGMALAVRMLGAALAAALLLAPGGGADRDRRDLEGLLTATLLATLYLNLMSYLVPWYGDLADKTGWIRLREALPWRALIAAALGLGALVPLAVMGAMRRKLGEAVAARLVAGLALFGFFLQTVWLFAPGFGGMAVLTAVVAIALGGLAIYAATTRRREALHAA